MNLSPRASRNHVRSETLIHIGIVAQNTRAISGKSSLIGTLNEERGAIEIRYWIIAVSLISTVQNRDLNKSKRIRKQIIQ